VFQWHLKPVTRHLLTTITALCVLLNNWPLLLRQVAEKVREMWAHLCHLVTD